MDDAEAVNAARALWLSIHSSWSDQHCGTQVARHEVLCAASLALANDQAMLARAAFQYGSESPLGAGRGSAALIV